jgi:hypothetical protein
MIDAVTAADLLRGIGGVVLVFSVAALLFMEALVAITKGIENVDAGKRPTSRLGARWLEMIHGAEITTFRKRIFLIILISGAILLVGLIV